MKMYCISDDIDKAVGLKLTGVKSVILNNKADIDNKINEIIKDKDIGILIVTENVYEISKEKLEDIKNNKKLPLIVKL